MQAIRNISVTTQNRNLQTKSKNTNNSNISFEGRKRNDKMSKTNVAMGAGLLALGAINVALVAKILLGKSSDSEKTIKSLQNSISGISQKISAIQEQTASAGFDKTKANQDIKTLKATIKALSDKIATLSKGDNSGKYTQLSDELTSIKTNLDKVTSQLNSSSSKDGAALSGVITDLQTNSDKLAQQLNNPVVQPQQAPVAAPVINKAATDGAAAANKADGTSTAKKVQFLNAQAADMTTVDNIKFENGIVKKADGTLFEGSVKYQMPDESTVTITTDDKGLITRSLREDSSGNMVFDKTYTRKTTDNNQRVLTIKTLNSDNTTNIMVDNAKYQDGTEVSRMVSRAIQQGDSRVQLSLLTKQDGVAKLLDGSKSDSSRVVEIIDTPKATQKTVIVKDKPLNYTHKLNAEGKDNYLLTDYEPLVRPNEKC